MLSLFQTKLSICYGAFLTIRMNRINVVLKIFKIYLMFQEPSIKQIYTKVIYFHPKKYFYQLNKSIDKLFLFFHLCFLKSVILRHHLIQFNFLDFFNLKLYPL